MNEKNSTDTRQEQHSSTLNTSEDTTYKIPIYDNEKPYPKRVMDVIVNGHGDPLRLQIKDVKGRKDVRIADMLGQIKEFMSMINT